MSHLPTIAQQYYLSINPKLEEKSKKTYTLCCFFYEIL